MSSISTTPPPVRLHCRDALTAEFTVEEQGERAKAVMQSSPRMPAVAFHGRYGDRWYVDIIAFTHNAVRRQLFDAFVMANALGKLLLDVTESDLARVYAWLGTLDSFVQTVFEIEDQFIYPLIDTHIKNARTSNGLPLYLPELLSIRGRKEAKSHVLDLLSDARKTRDVATGETIAKVNALRFALDQFGANILDYFMSMEKFAPRLLKRSILKKGDKEKDKQEKKIFEFFLRQPQGTMLAALLTQCIESKTKRREFLERNIKKEKLRNQFRMHVKHVESTHMQLATTFDEVASQYEKKFNVKTFERHYDAANYGKETAEMFGDMDINYEPVDDEEENDGESASNNNNQGVHEPRTELVEGGDINRDDHGVGLDDDVIEVQAGPDDDTPQYHDEDHHEYDYQINQDDDDDDDDEIEVQVPSATQ